MVAHSLWERGAVGSNPATPTWSAAARMLLRTARVQRRSVTHGSPAGRAPAGMIAPGRAPARRSAPCLNHAPPTRAGRDAGSGRGPDARPARSWVAPKPQDVARHPDRDVRLGRERRSVAAFLRTLAITQTSPWTARSRCWATGSTPRGRATWTTPTCSRSCTARTAGRTGSSWADRPSNLRPLLAKAVRGRHGRHRLPQPGAEVRRLLDDERPAVA